MIGIAVFAIVSTIIARQLEKAKFVVATITHAILFTVAFSIELLTSNIEIIQQMFIYWMGESTYNFLHDALVETSSGMILGFSVLFLVDLVSILSVICAAFITAIKAYKKILSKKIRFSKPTLITRLIPASGNNAPMMRNPGQTWNYIALGRLRN